MALVGGLGLRLVALGGKDAIAHDEAITYIASTCHQGEYDELTTSGAPPFGAWAPASSWQRLTRTEDSLCLDRIRDGLARLDIHPPLYFWLLHLWLLAVGNGLLAGPSLNLLLSLASTLALFGLARTLLGRPVEAAAIALVWAVGPAVVGISYEARQYDLLALITILFAWQVVRVAGMPEAPPRRDWALLAGVTAAGALTHYHFALVAAAGGIVLLHRLRAGERRRRLVPAGLSLAAGYAGFVALHPDFGLSLERQAAQSEPFDADQLPSRIDAVLSSLTGFFFPAGVLGPALELAVAAVVLAGAALAYRGARRSRVKEGTTTASPGAALTAGPLTAGPAVPIFLGVTGGAAVVLYLTFVSHGIAMGGKYLAAAWPFFAFLPVLAARSGRMAAARPLIAVCAALLALGTAGAVRYARGHDGQPAPAPIVASDAVVVDSVARGVLNRRIWGAPAGTRVFAAPQAHLLTHLRDWLEPPAPRTVYLSELTYGNTAERQALIVGFLSRGREVRRVRGRPGEEAHAFTAERRSVASSARARAKTRAGRAPRAPYSRAARRPSPAPRRSPRAASPPGRG